MGKTLLGIIALAIIFFSVFSAAEAYTGSDNVDETISLKSGWNLISTNLDYYEATNMTNETQTYEAWFFNYAPLIASTTCEDDPVPNFYWFNPTNKVYDIPTKMMVGWRSLPDFLNDRKSAYWVKVDEDCTITFRGIPKEARKVSGAWMLYDGWNLFGNPYLEDVSWDDLKGNCQDVRSGPWEWDAETQEYVRASVIEANKGYFVKVNGACAIGSAEGLPPMPQ